MKICLSCKATSGFSNSVEMLPDMSYPIDTKGNLRMRRVSIATCSACKQTCADLSEIAFRERVSIAEVAKRYAA